MTLFETIKNRRAIIDRKSLTLALDELGGEGNHGTANQRAQALAMLKAALTAGRAEVRRRFEEEKGKGGRYSGSDVKLALAFLMDQIIRLVFDFTVNRVYRLPNPTSAERLSVVAVGGYGRGELAPFSDVDLLFLCPYKQTPWGEQVVEYMLYLLWDLGLKVGHSTRSADDCVRLSRQDITIRTALLEQRWIWGDQDLATDLKTRYFREVVAKTGPEFIARKLQERDERHMRMGDSRYVVEPNIKEGKGGLRDLHALFWVVKYLQKSPEAGSLVESGIFTTEEYRRFIAAEEFLWTVRCHLHWLAGRAEERLTFDLQPEIAARLGFADRPGRRDVERFMKRYYLVAKEVGDLTRIFIAGLEAKHRKKRPLAALLRLPRRRKEVEGFTLDGGRISVASERIFERDPVKLLRLFHLAQERNMDVHPDALRFVHRSLRLIDVQLRENPEANRLFVEMLTSRIDPEVTLRRLNESGVFGRFVPDFGRVVAQMQYDMYHHYTVDEHTIRAIGVLARIEQGELAEEHPLANEIIHQVLSRRVLYIAVLLHDIAKGRGGDHSVLGEDVAMKLCPRFGLTPAETETVAWLVRWHLAMSATAFKRDLSDPKTVNDFANHVQSPERLKLLLLLTVADIRAVGPSVWNGWKGQLLREIYHQAEERLTGGHATKGREQRIAEKKAAALALLGDWSEEERGALSRRHYDSYWLSYDADAIARHARIMREADQRKAPLTLETRADRFRAVTELTLYAHDHPGLFARVTGAIATIGGNIVDAKIFTTNDGMAIDSFFIQDQEGGALDQPSRLAKLSSAIERTLQGELRPRLVMPADRPGETKRMRVFKVAPVVLIDNGASNWFTVIEVNGRDRPGLLYDVTRGLYDLNLTIGSAHIATFGERAVDVFYVKDLVGQKVTDKRRLGQIEKRLLAALTPPEEREKDDAGQPDDKTEAGRKRPAA